MAISYNIEGMVITAKKDVMLWSDEICEMMNPGEKAEKLMCVNVEDVCEDCDLCQVQFWKMHPIKLIAEIF